ncbi:hypothetical protein SAMN05443633_103179 [Chryseobacterium arachidis]|uniref:Uncharacterized protein n=1 Tax=Chryseobacterium arachidis TaxID=1416778 RepID=A0A1M4ZJW0_9FLAO|nr:hypothetical protein [Chryseobacterium arachidis]SHF18097.1 hypothetical protein SAMN05443633_103179 [Chryseobacterium arachidis]
MKIERTLFWFRDGHEKLLHLNEYFYGLSVLLNNLLNDKYEGKRIQFINIDFFTDKTYEIFPAIEKEKLSFFSQDLRYNGFFDEEDLYKMVSSEKKKYIWEKAYKYLIDAAEISSNLHLQEAVKYAYLEGLKRDLVADYITKSIDFEREGENYVASVWISFQEDKMYSKFTLEKDDHIIFEKNIAETKSGTEFFLEIYKKITVDKDFITIYGPKDVDHLPLKISFSEMFTV